MFPLPRYLLSDGHILVNVDRLNFQIIIPNSLVKLAHNVKVVYDALAAYSNSFVEAGFALFQSYSIILFIYLHLLFPIILYLDLYNVHCFAHFLSVLHF
jgi:hypothetical protein